MIKIIITSLILLVLIPAIGVTAQILIPEPEYINSVFNEPLALCWIWDLVVLIFTCGYKVVKVNCSIGDE